MGDTALEGIARQLAVNYKLTFGHPRMFGAVTSSSARNSMHELYLEDEGEGQRTLLRVIRDLGQGVSGRRYEQVSVSAADGTYELAYKTTIPQQSAAKFAPFAETPGDSLEDRFARTIGQALSVSATGGLQATSYRIPFSLRAEELPDVPKVIIRYLSADTVPPPLPTPVQAPDASRP